MSVSRRAAIGWVIGSPVVYVRPWSRRSCRGRSLSRCRPRCPGSRCRCRGGPGESDGLVGAGAVVGRAHEGTAGGIEQVQVGVVGVRDRALDAALLVRGEGDPHRPAPAVAAPRIRHELRPGAPPVRPRRSQPTVPGATGAFRRTALASCDGISADTLAEDTDIAMALCRQGWRVVHRGEAHPLTHVPTPARGLWHQRHRWAYGTLQPSGSTATPSRKPAPPAAWAAFCLAQLALAAYALRTDDGPSRCSPPEAWSSRSAVTKAGCWYIGPREARPRRTLSASTCPPMMRPT
ncbi:glycosyltransferase family 2 protein [Streptomyces sp. NPDC048270]|uniref:glycosyltransferase n=1 Tax=Streptomyces sp. NPDC048270 TaxID=3154615 RepID=UPI0033D852D7